MTNMQKRKEHEKELALKDFLLKNIGREIVLSGFIDAEPAWRYDGTFVKYTMSIKRLKATLPRGRYFEKIGAGTHMWFSLKDFPFVRGHSISPEMQKLVNMKGHKILLLGIPYHYVHANNDAGVGFKVKQVLGVLPLE